MECSSGGCPCSRCHPCKGCLVQFGLPSPGAEGAEWRSGMANGRQNPPRNPNPENHMKIITPQSFSGIASPFFLPWSYRVGFPPPLLLLIGISVQGMRFTAAKKCSFPSMISRQGRGKPPLKRLLMAAGRTRSSTVCAALVLGPSISLQLSLSMTVEKKETSSTPFSPCRQQDTGITVPKEKLCWDPAAQIREAPTDAKKRHS